MTRGNANADASDERTFEKSAVGDKNAAGKWRLVAPALTHPALAAGAEDVARALFALRFADAVDPERVKTEAQRDARGLGLRGEKRFGANTETIRTRTPCQKYGSSRLA